MPYSFSSIQLPSMSGLLSLIDETANNGQRVGTVSRDNVAQKAQDLWIRSKDIANSEFVRENYANYSNALNFMLEYWGLFDANQDGLISHLGPTSEFEQIASRSYSHLFEMADTGRLISGQRPPTGPRGSTTVLA